MRLLVILGNQLFPLENVKALSIDAIFMVEDAFLCSHFRYHQQKLVMILTAMRSYAQLLRDNGFLVHYRALDEAASMREQAAQSAPLPVDETDFVRCLDAFVDAAQVTDLIYFEVEGKAMQQRLNELVQRKKLLSTEVTSPMFLTERAQFQHFLGDARKPQMATFYKQQRRRLKVLLTEAGEPVGGQWSFDQDNRKKLPKDITPPVMPAVATHSHQSDVVTLVEQRFADHPGRARDCWWPTTRSGALAWLDDFLAKRIEHFGPYEDALSQRSDTLFHSVLSPMLNLGLLTPAEVLERTLEKAQREQVPLQSLEGFVRQIIGWREFVRGIHQGFSAEQHRTNFWQHERELAPSWYSGSTGIVPLDHAIEGANRLGWSHHIPRLMVIANLMTLCEIRPQTAHRWFMEMYVDGSSWVMGPNVYGMGLFSDGGIFATKPYICGSNYLLKMSDYKKGPWCDVVDGLYWRFIHRNREFFAGNPRLALMPRALDKLSAERHERIFAAAEEFLDAHTLAPISTP